MKIVMVHNQSEWTQDTRAGGRSHWYTPFTREVPSPDTEERSALAVAGEAYLKGAVPTDPVVYAALAELGIEPCCVAWRMDGPAPAEADLPTHWRRVGAELETRLVGFVHPPTGDAPWVRLPEDFRARCIAAFEAARPVVAWSARRAVPGKGRREEATSLLAVGEELIEPWPHRASRQLWEAHLKIEGPAATGAAGEAVTQDWHISPTATGWTVSGPAWTSSRGHQIGLAERQAWACWSDVPDGIAQSMIRRFAPGTARRLDSTP